MSRTKGFLALVVVSVLLVLVLLPHGRDETDTATVAESITLVSYADDGAPLWRIRAEDGRIDGPDQTLGRVSVDFYGADGEALRIDGDRLERAQGVSRLSGGVRIERDDDFLLETESMTWDEAAERLAAGPVALSAEDLRMSAAAFGYDLGTGTASFTGGVEASAVLEAEWAIRADRAEERNGVTTFYGGVTARSEEAGESFRCARLEVDSEAQSALLSGDVIGEWSSGQLTAGAVRVDDGGLWAKGDVTAEIKLETQDGP